MYSKLDYHSSFIIAPIINHFTARNILLITHLSTEPDFQLFNLLAYLGNDLFRHFIIYQLFILLFYFIWRHLICLCGICKYFFFFIPQEFPIYFNFISYNTSILPLQCNIYTVSDVNQEKPESNL